MSDIDPSKRIFLIDSNVWRAERLLRTVVGSALLYALQKHGGRLLVPEVVELEVTELIASQAAEAIDKIRAALATLRWMTGQAPDPPFPSAQEIRKAVDARFAELGHLIDREPFREAHARRALMSVIKKVPPNSEKDQQFKDSAIWEVAWERADQAPVFFVTMDKGFFEDREPKKGLAKALKQQIHGRNYSLSLHDSLPSALEGAFGAGPRVDVTELTNSVLPAVRDASKQSAEQEGWIIRESTSTTVKPFYTHRPNMLAVSFDVTFALEPTAADGRFEGSLQIRGECAFNQISADVSEIKFDEQLFAWPDSAEQGQQRRKRFVYGAVDLRIGSQIQTAPYTLRESIEHVPR